MLRLHAETLPSADDRMRLATDIDRLEQVVTRVIQESRRSAHDERAGHVRASCDLGQAVRRRLTFWSILASHQGREWTVDVPSGAQLVGVSQAELDVCLDALLNNVHTHTPAGTPFSVQVRPGRAAAGPWSFKMPDRGSPEARCRNEAPAAARAPASAWTSSAARPRRPRAISPPDGPCRAEPPSK